MMIASLQYVKQTGFFLSEVSGSGCSGAIAANQVIFFPVLPLEAKEKQRGQIQRPGIIALLKLDRYDAL